jgi:hypothetical protein
MKSLDDLINLIKDSGQMNESERLMLIKNIENVVQQDNPAKQKLLNQAYSKGIDKLKAAAWYLSNKSNGDGANVPVEKMAEEYFNHETYWKGLDESTRQLVTLRDTLFDGSWERMEGDLTKALNKGGYIYKLMEIDKIPEFLDKIDTLKKYEEQHKINLNYFSKIG